MSTLPCGTRVFVCTQSTDMRKSFDGLIAATKSVRRCAAADQRDAGEPRQRTDAARMGAALRRQPTSIRSGIAQSIVFHRPGPTPKREACEVVAS